MRINSQKYRKTSAENRRLCRVFTSVTIVENFTNTMFTKLCTKQRKFCWEQKSQKPKIGLKKSVNRLKPKSENGIFQR